MATETTDGDEVAADSGWDDHLRGVVVTTFASLMGLVAGVAATALAAGPNDNVGLYLLGGAILVQFPIYMAVGMNVDEFGPKEYLYVAFITFSMWFISWGILLTTGTKL